MLIRPFGQLIRGLDRRLGLARLRNVSSRDVLLDVQQRVDHRPVDRVGEQFRQRCGQGIRRLRFGWRRHLSFFCPRRVVGCGWRLVLRCTLPLRQPTVDQAVVGRIVARRGAHDWKTSHIRQRYGRASLI
ncbi:hypothetical protein ASG90_00475 [Nocardioides sp. Soil797]|nr:hypothetical protein ASG90_00475 [Nocardioides sp. Soil797]